MCNPHQGQNETQSRVFAAHVGSKEEATYLVIGAGTAGLSFIDSILTLDANATVVLVDRNSQPGGHWTKAYPFVRLHQASCNYGVNSLPLSNIRDKKGNEQFSVHDLASGQEVLQYYKDVVKQFNQCGRVKCYFGCEYSKDEHGNHIVTNIDTKEVTQISFRKIVVVHSNLLVPSMRNGPPFPIDSDINFGPVNDLPTYIESKQYKKYVVIGAGKTGSDAITYLLRSGIDQSAITWIMSRDIWYFLRDGIWKGYKSYRKDTMFIFDPLVKCKSLHEAFMQFEKENAVCRIDTNVTPAFHKGAIIDKAELAGFRSIKDVVRLGRVTGITSDEIKLGRGSVPLSSTSDTIFVDCMANFDGSYYGCKHSEDMKIFDGNQINLGPFLAFFNISFSAVITAYIESIFEDDPEMKNKLIYFLKGEGPTKFDYKTIFAQLYVQSKTFKALEAYPPALNFLINSRTNLDAPSHHYGGLLGFLWIMFGPCQLAKKTDIFVERVESGYYTDCQDCFGCAGQVLPQRGEIKIKKKSKVKSNYPPQKKSKPRFKLSTNCCTRATEQVIKEPKEAGHTLAIES